jgi:hypothetical protein
VLIFEFVCTRLPYSQAQALIIFSGDGGSLLLGSLLMTTFDRECAAGEDARRGVGPVAVAAVKRMGSDI